MVLSVLNIKILECIRSKIRDPTDIADTLNVELGAIKEHLNWLVYKKFITTDGKLTKKGFCKAPEGITSEPILFRDKRRAK
jgi:predicted transcriptional regulator